MIPSLSEFFEIEEENKDVKKASSISSKKLLANTITIDLMICYNEYEEIEWY
jgi:hypothetical protein